MNFSEKLESLIQTSSPLLLDIDVSFDDTPSRFSQDAEGFCDFILETTQSLKSSICGIQLHLSSFEFFGSKGFKALERFLRVCREENIFVLLDAQKNGLEKDMNLYAQTYLNPDNLLSVDAITANGYFGSDSMQPLIQACELFNKGVFVTVRSHNESASELQSAAELCVRLSEKIEEWNITTQSTQNFFASIGALVSGIEPGALKFFREEMPHSWIIATGIQLPTDLDEGLSVRKDGLGILFSVSLSSLYDTESEEFKNENMIDLFNHIQAS